MIVYISGPITGKTRDEVQRSFRRAAEDVERAYNEKNPGGRLWVINPVDIADWGLSWGVYLSMARIILYSGEVDSIYMLKGWEGSKGAQIEHAIAKEMQIKIGYQEEAPSRIQDPGDTWYRENFVEV